MKKIRLSRSTLKMGVTLFVFLLCCAIGSSEFTEVMRLQDNTSNDYTSQLQSASGSNLVSSHNSRERIPAKRQAVVRSHLQTASGGTTLVAARAHRVSDLLHFLSIQRT